MNLKPKIFEKNDPSFRVPHDDIHATDKIGKQLIGKLPKYLRQQVVVVCIGTDRSTGDALGPIVGTKLKEKSPSHFHVYGTLDDPIHAVNLEEQLKEINLKHRNPFIIGIDACLGRLKSVGFITLNDGPVKPGAGVNKQLPPVGDIHLTGIVNVSGFMEFFVLQNTRLSLVMKMAEAMAEGIYTAEQSLSQKPASPRLRWLK